MVASRRQEKPREFNRECPTCKVDLSTVCSTLVSPESVLLCGDCYRARIESKSTYYVGIMDNHDGRWVTRFPDFPGYPESDGYESFHDAVRAGEASLGQYVMSLTAKGAPIPTPTNPQVYIGLKVTLFIVKVRV